METTVLVFDFDGTLVDSNQVKYDAYFELFPRDERHAEVIRDVLAADFEASRYVILAKILDRLGDAPRQRAERVEALAEQYNMLALAGVKTCPACPGAEAVLQAFQFAYALYLSSTTPADALREIVAFREWTGYFRAIFGYPRQKAATLREILQREHVRPENVLVVGDGESDRHAAQETGCRFFNVKQHPLTTLLAYIEP